MKTCIFKNFYLLTVLLLYLTIPFSCSDDKMVNSNDLTFEEASSLQFISFKIGDRSIHLTELKADPWPFHGEIVSTDSITFDSTLTFPLSRSVYAFVPENQILGNHIETFGIEFNEIFSLNDIELNSNNLLSDEDFVKNYLNVGFLDLELSNFGFHQTYVIEVADRYLHSINIDDIQKISDQKNAILITGKFSGSIEYFDKIEDGNFKVIINN